MIFSTKKEILSVCLVFAFILQGCQSAPTQSSAAEVAPVKKEINYQKVFENALKLSGNRLPYKMQTRTGKDGSVIYAAEFPTKKKTSFQTLEMVLVMDGSCAEDTAPADMKQKNRTVGPGGASFDISFCAGNQSIKLVDSNRLSMSDHPHGIGLINLAKNIQAEAKK